MNLLTNPRGLEQVFPILRWAKHYSRDDLSSDTFAGIITAVLLVPQGIAYAMLAGLPPQAGLYASILPPMVYALMGTSRTLSVGPVSVAAIMIASALSAPEIRSFQDPVGNALVLAAETGLILALMSWLRMGLLVNFISHPVLRGFTSGAALLIIFSQSNHILKAGDWNECTLDLHCLSGLLQAYQPVTLLIGLLSIAGLVLFAGPLPKLLAHCKLNNSLATAIGKSGALIVVLLGALAVEALDLDQNAAVAIVGAVPSGLPSLGFQLLEPERWRLLLAPAVVIALIAYVESVAIAKVTANLRRQRIDPNQELLALGTANMIASVSGGMPVAGGFSRTMVNFSAGAVSQAASIVAALLLALSVFFFADLLTTIPKASLAAVILVAIVPLIKVRGIVATFRFDRNDGIAELSTFIGVIIFGIEEGLMLGISLTLMSYLWRSSRPHIAVVGQIPGTEHFRNVQRHSVTTWAELLMIRIDENLTFATTSKIEDFIYGEIEKQPQTRHVALVFSSVSHVDTTGLESLVQIMESLRINQITLHLTEVKGPVMDKLKQSELVAMLAPGKIYFRNQDAVSNLVTPEHHPH